MRLYVVRRLFLFIPTLIGASILIFVLMRLVPGDIAAQTERVLQNLLAVLHQAKMGAENVVKTTVYLTDMADFAKMNEVYGRYLGRRPPARTTIQAAALPRGARVEIDAIAAY